jgi:hypothetical protein
MLNSAMPANYRELCQPLSFHNGFFGSVWSVAASTF